MQQQSLPQPPRLPEAPFLQLIRWIGNPTGFLDSCTAKFGETFTVKWGSFPPFVMLSNPDHIKQLFELKGFDSGRANEILRPLAGNYSLMTLDGVEHQRQRRLMLPSFHGERLQQYGVTIQSIAYKEMESWQAGQIVDVLTVMQRISFQTIVQTLFGDAPQGWQQELQQQLKRWLDFFGTPIGVNLLVFPILQQDWGAWSPWGWSKRQQQRIDRLLFSEFDRRRANPNPDRGDLLSMLMSAQDESGQELSNLELRDEILTLLVAGNDATASAISWGLYWLTQILQQSR